MDKHIRDVKNCDLQLLQGEPLETWTVDELGKYAEAQHIQIEQQEKALAPVYWQLGETLNLARKNFAHGQWSRFLEQWGIDKGRASKARAIHRTFEKPQQVEKMSVQEAYGCRKRQPRKRSRSSSTASPKGREHATSLGDWLFEVCQQVDSYFDEAAHATGKQAEQLKVAIDVALEQLQCLRALLEHENQDSGDRDMLSLADVQQQPASSTPHPKLIDQACHKYIGRGLSSGTWSKASSTSFYSCAVAGRSHGNSGFLVLATTTACSTAKMDDDFVRI